MKRVAVLIAMLALAACTSTPPAEPPPPRADLLTTRNLPQGAVVGFVDADTQAHVWRAIPYAKAPVGDLRWRAPRPPERWTGQREAVKPAPWCPQQLSALDGVDKARFGEIVGQEDCLYLNVYAPPMDQLSAQQARLPVMVWIHGGSNTWGRAEQYDGSALASRFKVIVVIIQYRIGALGWMAHPALREGGTLPDDASPNFGTLDQIRALEWVRDEIAPFGGDPTRVTIFGESAGGHNVASLLVSPRAKGLFHRAIIQSGSFRSTPLAEAEGLEGGKPEAGLAIAPRIVGAGKSATGETLRAAPVKAIYDAYRRAEGDLDPIRVIADGAVLPAGGLDAVLGDPAAYNAVPVITGTNRDELKLFNALNPKLVTFVLGRLPRIRDKPFYEAASGYPSRMWRANAVDEPAARMTGGGHTPVWTYRFDWDEEGKILGTDLGQLLGAGHSLEIPFVFGHFQLLGAFDKFAFTDGNRATRTKLSDAMMSYWVNFAATGSPGKGVAGDLPEWKAWSNVPQAERLILFDTEKGGGVRMTADQESGRRIVADLLADTTLKTPAQRCDIFTRLVRDNPELRPLGPAGCPAAGAGRQ
ncbi:PnbA Carboxylesterase type B [Caulobacteraceae bacterium]